MFIPNLYMFRALVCSSSGALIVSIWYLVYVTLCRWPSGMQVWVPPKPAYQTVTYIDWHTPDVALIQLILLMMSTRALETCRDIRKKNCASSWSFTRIIPRGHGQQNIKFVTSLFVAWFTVCSRMCTSCDILSSDWTRIQYALHFVRKNSRQ